MYERDHVYEREIMCMRERVCVCVCVHVCYSFLYPVVKKGKTLSKRVQPQAKLLLIEERKILQQRYDRLSDHAHAFTISLFPLKFKNGGVPNLF